MHRDDMSRLRLVPGKLYELRRLTADITSRRCRVEAYLTGAELMFELMGCKHTGHAVLTLKGPIDPDTVSSVSRDAVVAFVECQILKEIWETVSKNFTISWLEVLEFHWNSAEQAIRALNFLFLECMHQIREKNSTSSCSNYSYVQPMGIDPSLTALAPSTMTYHHPITNNYNSTIVSAMCKPDKIYSTDGNFFFTPVDTGTLSNRFASPYNRRSIVTIR